MQRDIKIYVTGGVDRERYKRLILSAEKKLDKLKIPYAEVKRWEINTRAKRRFGQCCKSGGKFTINLSVHLFQAKDEEIEEVILHELLHTCYGCMNHGKRWKKYAEKIYQAYGIRIKVTGNDGEYGQEYEKQLQQEYHYLFRCTSCGKSFGYFRMCPSVRELLSADGAEAKYIRCKCGGRTFIRLK